MLLMILALVVCFAATILQFAVYRSPEVVDTFLAHTGRRLSVVGSILAVLFLLHGLVMADTPHLVCLILMLYGLSQSLFAVRDLYPHLDKEHPQWTSRLNSLR